MPTESDPIPHDRRRHCRFASQLDLKYRLATGTGGTGRAVNMSSGGLLFRCGMPLPVGTLIEVDLQWPVLLDERHPMQLRLSGMTLRSTREGTAIAISKYEFRIAPR